MLTAFMLMPALGAAGFGMFSLALATQLFLLGAVDAAVLTPLVVSSSKSEGQGGYSYLRQRFALVLGISAILALALFFALLTFKTHIKFPVESSDFIRVLAALALGAFGLCAKESVRSLMLIGNRYAALMLIEGMTSLALIGIFVYIIHFRSSGVGVGDALISIALVNCFAVFVGLIATRPPIVVNVDVFFGFRKNGMKSLFAAKITWIQSQSYLFIVGFLASSAAAGYLAASRMVFAPLQAIFSGLMRGLLPDLAAYVASKDSVSFARALRNSYAGFGVLVVVWTLLAALLTPSIFSYFGAIDVVPSMSTIFAWGLVFFLTALRAISSLGLKSASRFDLLVSQGMAGAFMAIVSVPAVIYIFDSTAAPWGLALAELVAFLLSAFSIRSICRALQ